MSEHSPSQAPVRGRLARLLGPFHVTGVFWFRFHRFGARVLPEWLKPIVVTIFSGLFFVLLRRIRSAVASNLSTVLGPCGWWQRQRRIFRTFHTFAWCLTERYERLTTDPKFEFLPENLEALDRAMAQGRGVVFVTSHIGNWEIGASLPAPRFHRTVHLVREEELDPRAQQFIERVLRDSLGSNFETHFASRDLRLGMLLREALARGDFVALQGDRPRAGGRTLTVQLFEHPYSIPVGPLAVARTTEAPLLPVYVFRVQRHTYRLVMREEFAVPRTANRSDDLQLAADRLAESIEWAIREDPFQWFCFREAWPPEEGSASPSA